MTQRNQFIESQTTTWNGGDGEDHAVVSAAAQGAKRLGRAIHDQWRLRRGDIPASLWQFPDGSTAIIADDGSLVL
jgi:hypothetical protein